MTSTSSSEHHQAPQRRSIDQSKIAYQKTQPAGMVPDVFVESASDLDGDEREWVPQSETVAFRPLVLNVSQGYYINILRVRSSGVLSRHRFRTGLHAARKMALPRARLGRYAWRLRIRAVRRDTHPHRSG